MTNSADLVLYTLPRSPTTLKQKVYSYWAARPSANASIQSHPRVAGCVASRRVKSLLRRVPRTGSGPWGPSTANRLGQFLAWSRWRRSQGGGHRRASILEDITTPAATAAVLRLGEM